MHENLEFTPEKPHDNLTPSLKFLLDGGAEWFWDNGEIETAEKIFEITCEPDSATIKKLHEQISWLGSGLPADIHALIEELQGSDRPTKAEYLQSLESIIKDTLEKIRSDSIASPSLLDMNALHLAANIKAEEVAHLIHDIRSAIAPKLSNDEEGRLWLFLNYEANRFFEHIVDHSAQSQGPDVFRDFINTLDLSDFNSDDAQYALDNQ